MDKLNKLILIGGGGHCRACIDVIQMQGVFEIEGIIDVQENLGKKIEGYSIIGTDKDIGKYAAVGFNFLITVGFITSANVRIKLFDTIQKAGGNLVNIISPLAYVSRSARLGQGNIIMHHAIVNAGTVIGDNCIINTKALIEHDVAIADQVHVATTAVINGHCNVGSESMIGSGSIVLQTLSIGANVILGAGSVVTSSIIEPGVYFGTPAKKK